MKKLNSVVYQKLLLQAQEAEEQGLTKLASGLSEVLSDSLLGEEYKTYSGEELDQDIYNDLWKTASHIIKYYNVESVNSEKLHQVIESLANTLFDDVSYVLDTEGISIGKLEPSLPGETK